MTGEEKRIFEKVQGEGCQEGDVGFEENCPMCQDIRVLAAIRETARVCCSAVQADGFVVSHQWGAAVETILSETFPEAFEKEPAHG